MSLNLDKSGWPQVRFGDVVRSVNDSVRDPEGEGIDRVIAMEHMDPGELAIDRWGSLEDGTSFTRRVRPGQTLFGKRRAYQRKVAFAEFDAICSGDILTFESDKSEMLAEFLPFLVQSDAFFDHALGTSAGSLSPRTNWRDLAKFEFNLPPLGQQKLIADLLWAVEHHRIDTVKLHSLQVSAQRKHLPELLFKEAVGEPRPIGEVATVKHGFAFPGTGFSDDPDYPTVVTPGNFAIGGGFQQAAPKTFTGTYAEGFVLNCGDVIVTMTDLSKAGDTLGYSAVVPDDGRTYLHNQRIGKVVLKSGDAVLPEFLAWALRTNDYHDYMLRTAAGSTVRHTSPTRIEQYPIRLPGESAQRAALDKIRRFSEAQLAIQNELVGLSTLRSAILAQTFGGI